MPSTDCPALVVFDCDGTLIDSQFAIHQAMARAFQAMQLSPPHNSAVRRIVGLNLDSAINKLMPPSADRDLLQVGVEAYKEAYLELRLKPDYVEPLFPGTREAIETLAAKGYLLGIATGKARRGLDATLERHGLTNSFVTLQTPDTNPGKPNPDMLYSAMSDSGADAHRTMMVGDTSFDMEMAVAAKVRGIGVSWGYHAVDELKVSGAVEVIDHYEALPQLVEQLTGGSQ